MRFAQLGLLSLIFAFLSVLSGRLIGRHVSERSQDQKVFEICAVITEEVQTGSMNKAIENAKVLFLSAFPSSIVSVQIKEQKSTYGAVPSTGTLYRQVSCEIESRSDVSAIFIISKEELISKAFFLWVSLGSAFFFVSALIASLAIKKVSTIAQRRFNLELQNALGLSAELPQNGFVSRFLEAVVQGVGRGKNLRESVENLKRRINEKNQEALSLRESQLATDLELKKNEKFIEVVRQVRHDIRSPLQALTALTGFEVDSSTSKRQVKAVIASIHEMIEDLEIKEEIADSSGNGERLHVAEALIKEVLQQKRVLFEATKIELKINSDFLSVVHVQPHHFRRVIGNLLQNAHESMFETCEDSLILIETEKVGSDLQIIIKDNGKGIDPDVLEKLFTSGFTHGKENGSGLGLSHAKSCIVRWQGRITLESVPGTGTTVKIILPIAMSDAKYVAKAPAEDIKLNVVVDDDPEDFGRLQRSLPGPAVYCSSLEDFESWQSVTTDQADIQFIFDYNLGEKRSGLEVLKTVQVGRPRILSTNDYDRQDVLAASREGIYVLPKVFLL